MLHLLWPGLSVDATLVALLVVAVLPWLPALFKSLELPGGWKIEFRDVQEAGEKAAPLSDASETAQLPTAQSSTLGTVGISRDANLALVALRIDIEKLLRALAQERSIRTDRPLNQLLQDLAREKVLSASEFQGLRELISFGNRAAHGVEVEPEVADWATAAGPAILQALDAKLLNRGA